MAMNLTFWSENLKERNNLEDLGVGKKIMTKKLTETGWMI
jgi:hypothetical protein